MEEVKCLFCHEEHPLFWEENGYLGRKCFSCGLIYMSPRPDEEEMAILYSYDCSGGDSFAKHTSYSFARLLMTKYTLSLIKKFKKNGDLLEIGAGGGHFSFIARRYGFKPYALEVNQRLVRHIREKLKVEAENYSASNPDYFPDKNFDLVYSREVLSHLHNPIGSLKIINSKLKADGILVFETGNLGGIRKFWLKFIGRLGYPEHMYLFSTKSVKELLAITGFKLKAYYSHSNVLYYLISKMLETTGSNSSQVDSSQKKTLKFKKFKDFVIYFFIYRLGRILPRSWPATIIYVAAKK